MTCDGNTITFKLNKSVPDFNYATTLGFFPGPQGQGHRGELRRASHLEWPVQGRELQHRQWRQDDPDPERCVGSGIQPDPEGAPPTGGRLLRHRCQGHGPAADREQRPDATAIQYGNVQPENLATVFADKATPNARFAGRASSEYDAYVGDLHVEYDVDKVPDEKVRQAMAVALDRQALLVNAGGAFAGDLADGVIKPNIGEDYAETGWATDMFGEAIPPTGNVELAKRLITESGAAAPTLQYDYPQSPVNDQAAAIVKDSLEKAGFTVKPNPIDPGVYYSVVFDPKKAGEFGAGGWGPDWPNASTVIPPRCSPRRVAGTCRRWMTRSSTR